jgi:hypothetical protein
MSGLRVKSKHGKGERSYEAVLHAHSGPFASQGESGEIANARDEQVDDHGSEFSDLQNPE